MQLKISGMTCGHCVSAVRKALQAVSGVGEVSVELESGIADINGDADLEQLLAAVKEEGYEVEAV